MAFDDDGNDNNNGDGGGGGDGGAVTFVQKYNRIEFLGIDAQWMIET